MKAKKTDILVIITITAILFGGIHLMKNKRLDGERPVPTRGAER